LPLNSATRFSPQSLYPQPLPSSPPRYDPNFLLDSAAQLGILAACDALLASDIVFAKFDAATGETTKVTIHQPIDPLHHSLANAHFDSLH
jgi:hypothetical protein